MIDKDSATKLKERVTDWQSYLGRAENQWAAPPDSAPSVPFADSGPVTPSAEAEPIASDPQSTQPTIEVSAPAQEISIAPSTRPSAATVVEVLPPDTTTRPYHNGSRKMGNGKRPPSVAERSGALFADTREAEEEYAHARRANMILSVFVVVLLGVLFTAIAWVIVD